MNRRLPTGHRWTRVGLVAGCAAAMVATFVGAWQLAGAGYADAGPQPGTLVEDTNAGYHPYLLDCSGTPVRQPTQFVLSCADANSSLVNVTWRSWGGAQATGTGKYVENNCIPDCSRGDDVAYPVQITADGLVRKGSSAAYRRITATFTEKAPASSVGGRESFDLPIAPFSEETTSTK